MRKNADINFPSTIKTSELFYSACIMHVCCLIFQKISPDRFLWSISGLFLRKCFTSNLQILDVFIRQCCACYTTRLLIVSIDYNMLILVTTLVYKQYM